MSSARLSNSVPVRTQTGRLATNWASRLGISSRIVLAGLLSLAVMLLAVAPPLFSQEAIGTIRGAVFDSTGAAIAGATVTVLDVARGTTRVLTTNAAGEYTAPALLVGLYSVRGEAKGFQTLERTNVNLDIGQDVRVDLTLQPGAQTQTITVTSEAPSIDTTSATLGGAVTNQSIQDLPLISRNFLQLLQLRPGVVDVPGGTGTATVTNGRREGSDVLVIEGVTQFDLATSNVLINGANKGGGDTDLPLDSVQEFSTQQNAPAEYGWRDGSAISLGIKSGTNAIHGSAYAFGRDSAVTDAKNYSASGIESRNLLTVEQPGFTLGGPAIKNKLFWFISAEFIRSSSIDPSANTEPFDLPAGAIGAGTGCGGVDKTAAVGNCNYSLFDACTDIGGISKVNPLSAQIAGLTATTGCAPQAPSSTYESLFPYNQSTSNVLYPNPLTTSPSNNGLAKVDWNPNERNHFSGFVYVSKQTQVASGKVQPYWGTSGVGSTEEYAGAWTYTPSATWLNDLRGGAAPNFGDTIADDQNRLPVNFYPTGYSVNTGVTNPAYGGMPCINISSIYGSGMNGLGQCGKLGQRGPQAQLDFSDKVSHQIGNHAIKFGYEEVFVFFDDSSLANANGTVSFTSLENYLLGATNSASILTGNNFDNYRERWHAAFVEDTWRVTRKITLTPGLRWEYIGSPHSIFNHLGAFNPDYPGGVTQVGPGLQDTSVIHPQKDDFNPRMGFAWDLRGNGRTVLRAGGGLLSSFPAILTATGAGVPYGQTLCAGPTCTAADEVVNRFGTPQQGFVSQTLSFGANQVNWTTACTAANVNTCTGPTGGIFPLGTAITPTSGPVCTTNTKASATNETSQCNMLVSDPNLKSPRSVQWNVDVQRALTNSLTLDVAYVGTYGYNEIQSIDLNEPALGSGWDASAICGGAVSGPASSCVGVTPTATSCLGSVSLATYTSKCAADATAEQNARPFNAQFPYYKYIVETKNGFHSNYNGLQVTLISRPWHGLNFVEGYTLSHALDDWTKSSQATSALADPANENYQYGRGDMNVTHRMRFSGTYTIPGIKTPGQMLEGWSLNGIWAVQSGFAWAPDDNKTDDWGGTGENADSTIPTPNSGVWQSWNYQGPTSAFSDVGATPIPCYGQASGCTNFSAPGLSPTIFQTCLTAAQAPYAGNAQEQQLAEAALLSGTGACYMQKGGILTPPAYGTLGNAKRGMFTGPNYQNVDLALEKVWHVKERFSAQLRVECYNVFNHVNYAQFTDGGLGSADPSAGGGQVGVTGFGYHTTAQGAPTNGNRQFQFGLKFMF